MREYRSLFAHSRLDGEISFWFQECYRASSKSVLTHVGIEMKKIVSYFNDIFSPKDLQGLNVNEILSALNDSSVCKEWIYEVCEELKRLNLEVDRRLLTNQQWNLTDLAARRKAYQDVLESLLAAKRRVKSPNPPPGSFDLSSVTVEPA